METKAQFRSKWQTRFAEHEQTVPWGKIAQKLRMLKTYQDAVTVFATPEPSLLQARINCLADGKNLIMPGPALIQGFYLITARSVAFRNIPAAVTFHGLERYGSLLRPGELVNLSLELLITGSVVVDRRGGRIGEGKGFFDLSCALLQELGGLGQYWSAYSLVSETSISADTLPQDIWDIKLNGLVTPTEILSFAPTHEKPRIYWKELPLNRVRKSNLLWQQFRAGQKT